MTKNNFPPNNNEDKNKRDAAADAFEKALNDVGYGLDGYLGDVDETPENKERKEKIEEIEEELGETAVKSEVVLREGGEELLKSIDGMSNGDLRRLSKEHGFEGDLYPTLDERGNWDTTTSMTMEEKRAKAKELITKKFEQPEEDEASAVEKPSGNSQKEVDKLKAENDRLNEIYDKVMSMNKDAWTKEEYEKASGRLDEYLGRITENNAKIKALNAENANSDKDELGKKVEVFTEEKQKELDRLEAENRTANRLYDGEKLMTKAGSFKNGKYTAPEFREMTEDEMDVLLKRIRENNEKIITLNKEKLSAMSDEELEQILNNAGLDVDKAAGVLDENELSKKVGQMSDEELAAIAKAEGIDVDVMQSLLDESGKSSEDDGQKMDFSKKAKSDENKKPETKPKSEVEKVGDELMDDLAEKFAKRKAIFRWKSGKEEFEASSKDFSDKLEKELAAIKDPAEKLARYEAVMNKIDGKIKDAMNGKNGGLHLIRRFGHILDESKKKFSEIDGFGGKAVKVTKGVLLGAGLVAGIGTGWAVLTGATAVSIALGSGTLLGALKGAGMGALFSRKGAGDFSLKEIGKDGNKGGLEKIMNNGGNASELAKFIISASEIKHKENVSATRKSAILGGITGAVMGSLHFQKTEIVKNQQNVQGNAAQYTDANGNTTANATSSVPNSAPDVSGANVGAWQPTGDPSLNSSQQYISNMVMQHANGNQQAVEFANQIAHWSDQQLAGFINSAGGNAVPGQTISFEGPLSSELNHNLLTGVNAALQHVANFGAFGTHNVDNALAQAATDPSVLTEFAKKSVKDNLSNFVASWLTTLAAGAYIGSAFSGKPSGENSRNNNHSYGNFTGSSENGSESEIDSTTKQALLQQGIKITRDSQDREIAEVKSGVDLSKVKLPSGWIASIRDNSLINVFSRRQYNIIINVNEK